MENIGDKNIENQEYYREIINFLRCAAAGEHWNSEKTWVRAQAVYFSLKDNELYYGKTIKNKKVVINELHQIKILDNMHIDRTKGHHLGAKKMLRMLLKDYFWRNAQLTVAEYIKNCTVCTSNSSFPLEPLANKNQLNPWRNVEFHWLEPVHSQQNNCLALIYDPASFWLSAAPILFNSFEISLFMFENYCNHGLASCSLYGIDLRTFEQIKNCFIELAEKANSPLLSTGGFLVLKENESASFNNNMKGKVELYLQDPNWSERTTILSWLWKLRNETINGTSALEMICNQNQNLAASSKTLAKRKPISTTFRCQVCSESFSSAVTLRSHCSTHASYERVTHSSTFDRCDSNNTTVHSGALSESAQGNIELSSTVSAVRAIIEEKRTKPPSKKLTGKRGEYHRYSMETRDNIAEYALLHGNHEAARAFSSSLGFPVSYSSVRNFVQGHYVFPSQTKLEIGRYAAECGIENAQKFYSAKLNKTISESMIKRFRRIYYRTTPAGGHHNNVSQFRKKCVPPASRPKFCASVRQEIGLYAIQNGIEAAIAHFSEKLQFPIKETTVRKFKKAVNNMSSNPGNLQSAEPHVPPPLPPSSPPAPEPILQQTQESNYYHSSQSYNHFPAPQYVYQSVNSYHHSNHQNLYGMPQQMQSTIQTYPSYNSLPHPQHYQPMQMPSYSRAVGSGWNEECQDISTSCNELLQMQQPNNFNQHHHSAMQQQRHGMIAGSSSSVIPAVIPPPLELNLQNNEMLPHVQRNDVRKATKKINRRPSTKRGNYATYTPEFRLEVGKFAATYGCQEASQHFKERIGHEIPDSTLRLLRDKYLSRRLDPNEKEITSLNTGPRGRPSLLGKHDAEVQDCLRELKRSGEKINAFVAMTCARQVLMQKEPALLNTVKLTTSWAKTFLRRIGINKENSQAQISNSEDDSN